MTKLSKSELTTPEMEERAKVAGETLETKRCLHFAVNTDIVCGNRKATILSRSWGGYCLVRWHDSGETRVLIIRGLK